jgi:hypothetical protein
MEVESTQEMFDVAVDFYKNLFGKEDKMDINLDEDFWESDDLVTVAENNFLDQPFSEDEIKEAVFGSYADGPPDGFSFFVLSKFLGNHQILLTLLTCLGILRRMKRIY